MIAAKHMDPVMGIDIHIIQPPGPVPPIPVPHPFVGMLIDAVEYAPYIGGTVKVNGMMRGVAGTGGKAVPHIPIGGAFVPPIPSNDCTQFMGSQTVAFDSDPAARLGDMVLSCQSIGLPPPPRAKPHEKGHSQYLPTSAVLAVPAGPPVLVGGPPTITVMGALKMLGPFIRFIQQSSRFASRFQALSQRIMSRVANWRQPFRWLAEKGICFLTGHPVDVATGQVLTEDTDIELPGPLPFKFARVWYSRSDHRGPLGHGWHHNFDLSVKVGPDGVIIARLADGHLAGFDPPVPGEPSFNRKEKLFLHLTERGYELEDLNGLRHSFGWGKAGGPEVPLDHVRDPNGNRIKLERDRGQLTAFIDSGGRRLPVVSDSAGRILEVRGPDPDKPGETFPLVKYQYGRDGDLIRVDDAEGHPFRYEYVGHQLLRETNRDGTSFYFMYDGPGIAAKCLRTWGDNDQFLRELTYDDARQRTEVIDSLGHKTVYEWHDLLGAVTAMTDPLGGVTKTEWSLDGDKLSETNPVGGKTSFEYDDFGRLVGVTDAAGGTAAMTFDTVGNQVAFTDPGGKVWKREYDDRRNVVAVTDPLGHRRTYDLDSRGLPVMATDPLGNTAHFNWTSTGQLAGGTDRAGGRTVFEYDLLGRVVKRTDAVGNAVRMKYERRGKVTEFTNESGSVTRLKYNPAGNLSETADPLGRVRSFQYAVMGRVAEVRTPTGRVTKYGYDTEGRLIEARNPADRVWRFTLNPIGNVVEESTYDGRILRYKYNPAGFVTESRNARGQTTKFDRDGVGRLLKRTHADGSVDTFKYTPGGQIVGAKNAAAEVRLSYDACGRVAEEKLNGKAVRHTYDANGNRTKRVSPFGRTLHFENDADGRLLAVADGKDPLFRSRFDPLGREVERTAGNAVWNWDYRPTGEMAGVNVRGLSNREREYEYNAAGDPTAQVDSTFGRTDYSHNADGYLIGVKHADGTAQEYAYDRGGDVIRPASVGIRRDADGQVVEKTIADATWKYEYDGFGQLMQAKSASGLDVRFAYDPFGRRVRKTVGADTTEFVWDGGLILGETGERLAEYLFRPGTFEPLAVFANGDKPAVLDCDPVGLPRIAWHPDGEQAWQADFEPFGEIRSEAGTPGLVPIRYPGQYADDETGLFYNRFRYHDPEQRAFTRPDPLGIYGNAGVWEYVPSPLSWIDPYALACMTPNQIALKELGNEASLGGRKAVSAAEAEILLDWAKEVGTPFRASASDLATSANHWIGGAHIHIEGIGRGGHIPVLPGVIPR